MNKLEQLYLDALENEEAYCMTQDGDYIKFVENCYYCDVAIKSAEITEQIAVEFAEWIADSKKHGWSKQLYEAMIVNKVKTTKELFQEFLKTKQ